MQLGSQKKGGGGKTLQLIISWEICCSVKRALMRWFNQPLSLNKGMLKWGKALDVGQAPTQKVGGGKRTERVGK